MSTYRPGDEIFLPVMLRKSIINHCLASDLIGGELRAGMEHALLLEDSPEASTMIPWRPISWRRDQDTKEGHAFLFKDLGKSLRDEKSLCGAITVNETEHVIMESICLRCRELERSNP